MFESCKTNIDAVRLYQMEQKRLKEEYTKKQSDLQREYSDCLKRLASAKVSTKTEDLKKIPIEYIDNGIGETNAPELHYILRTGTAKKNEIIIHKDMTIDV